MDKPRLWTKDFIIISLTNFFVHVVFYLLMATVAVYVMSEYGAGSGMAGLTVGIYVISALVARVFAGKYLDRIGRKRALIGSFVIFTVSMLLHFGANSLLILFIIRFIQGAAHGFLTTASGAVAAEIIPDERRGEGTGYYATSMNLAMALGPFLGIYLSGYADFRMIILAGSIIAIIGLVSTFFLQVPKSDYKERAQKISGFNVRDYVEPKAVPISILLFLVTFAYSSLLAFLSLYAAEIQLVEISSFFFIVYAASLIVSRPMTGKWFDQYGENRVTYPLLLCMAIGLFLLSQAHNGFLFLLSAVFIGIGYGTVQSNFLAIAIKQSPPNRTALATSTFFIFLDLASGLGPYLLGIVVGMMSFRHLYITTSIWILGCIILYYFVHGKKAAAKRKEMVHHSA